MKTGPIQKIPDTVWQYSFVLAAMMLIITACNSETSPTIQSIDLTEPVSTAVIPETKVAVEGESYPSPGTESPSDESYPGAVELDSADYQQDPPDPSRELPEATAETGVIGGVLIEEVHGKGYIPLLPLNFFLGKILFSDSGEPSYIRTGADSVKAELFSSGIFIFHSIEPGSYGLVVDLGFTSFVINDEDGNPIVIDVEPGSVIDLGQVITNTQRS